MAPWISKILDNKNSYLKQKKTPYWNMVAMVTLSYLAKIFITKVFPDRLMAFFVVELYGFTSLRVKWRIPVTKKAVVHESR